MVKKYVRLTDKGEKIEVHLIWKNNELSEIRRLYQNGDNKFKECYYKEEKSEYFKNALEEEMSFLDEMCKLRQKLLAEH